MQNSQHADKVKFVAKTENAFPNSTATIVLHAMNIINITNINLEFIWNVLLPNEPCILVVEIGKSCVVVKSGELKIIGVIVEVIIGVDIVA